MDRRLSAIRSALVGTRWSCSSLRSTAAPNPICRAEWAISRSTVRLKYSGHQPLALVADMAVETVAGAGRFLDEPWPARSSAGPAIGIAISPR